MYAGYRDGLKVAWSEDHSFRVSALQFVAGFALATVLLAMREIGVLTWLLLIGLFPARKRRAC